jgi:hypothetical protein
VDSAVGVVYPGTFGLLLGLALCVLADAGLLFLEDDCET